jgi:hypothetical protein
MVTEHSTSGDSRPEAPQSLILEIFQEKGASQEFPVRIRSLSARGVILTAGQVPGDLDLESCPSSDSVIHLPKGEMLAQCRNLSLIKLAPLSISCARPVVGRWQGESVGSCGYCYPCLVRRAALHRLGWDKGQDYRVDFLTESEFLRHRVKGLNLRAVCLALKTWEENPQDMLARLRFSGSPEEISKQVAAAQRLLEAGFGEIALWLRDQGGGEIKEFLGGRIITLE